MSCSNAALSPGVSLRTSEEGGADSMACARAAVLSTAWKGTPRMAAYVRSCSAPPILCGGLRQGGCALHRLEGHTEDGGIRAKLLGPTDPLRIDGDEVDGASTSQALRDRQLDEVGGFAASRRTN